jgi:hypothetical protein
MATTGGGKLKIVSGKDLGGSDQLGPIDSTSGDFFKEFFSISSPANVTYLDITNPKYVLNTKENPKVMFLLFYEAEIKDKKIDKSKLPILASLFYKFDETKDKSRKDLYQKLRDLDIGFINVDRLDNIKPKQESNKPVLPNQPANLSKAFETIKNYDFHPLNFIKDKPRQKTNAESTDLVSPTKEQQFPILIIYKRGFPTLVYEGPYGDIKKRSDKSDTSEEDLILNIFSNFLDRITDTSGDTKFLNPDDFKIDNKKLVQKNVNFLYTRDNAGNYTAVPTGTEFKTADNGRIEKDKDYYIIDNPDPTNLTYKDYPYLKVNTKLKEISTIRDESDNIFKDLWNQYYQSGTSIKGGITGILNALDPSKVPDTLPAVPFIPPKKKKMKSIFDDYVDSTFIGEESSEDEDDRLYPGTRADEDLIFLPKLKTRDASNKEKAEEKIINDRENTLKRKVGDLIFKSPEIYAPTFILPPEPEYEVFKDTKLLPKIKGLNKVKYDSSGSGGQSSGSGGQSSGSGGQSSGSGGQSSGSGSGAGKPFSGSGGGQSSSSGSGGGQSSSSGSGGGGQSSGSGSGAGKPFAGPSGGGQKGPAGPPRS